MLNAYQHHIRRGLWHLVPPDATAPAVEPTDLPPIQDDDDLDRALRDYLGVKLPAVRCCQHHQTPWDAVHDAFFARSVVAIWKASRGLGGKSFTLSALSMAEALFLRADVNILGGSGVQSKRVLEAIGKMWDHPGSPRQCLKSLPGNQVQKLTWGNRIQALMASQASVRGPHPQRLRLDEVDEMKQDILDAALGQPMSKGWVVAHVVGASTHQYPNGMMTEMLKRAATHPDWRVMEWCYRENLEPHGWLSLAEVERKKAILTAGMWEVEIELQEPSAEGRAFDTTKIDQVFVPATLHAESGVDRAVFELPVAGAKYGTGSDWAKKRNYTVTTTIRHDVTPARVVCITRTQKQPWPVMVQAAEDQARQYPGIWCHDNTGLGQVVDDLIEGVSAEPFDMVGRQRADLLSEYVASVEHGEIVFPRSDDHPVLAAVYSEHKYATRDDLYRGSKDGSTKFHLPDTISSGALAWRACGGVEAASSLREPDPDDHPNLQRGIQRGRLSSYIRLGGRLPGQDRPDDHDADSAPDPVPPVRGRRRRFDVE
jgi:hypothetical protein